MPSASQAQTGNQAQTRTYVFARMPWWRRKNGELSDPLRIALVLTCLLALWNHTPWIDLSDRAILETQTSGTWTTQALFISLALAMGAALWQLGIARLRPLLSWPLLLCAGWLGLTLLTSIEPLLSLRRIILFGIAVMICAGIPVVMRNVRQFAFTLAIAALVILLASYLSVALVPELSIHNDFDLINEPEHAGLWRGIFAHKNEASGAMALLVIVGLFVASAASRVWGVLIVATAAAFMVFANSKSVIALMPFVVFAPYLCLLFKSAFLRAVILVGPIIGLSLFSLGSVFIPAIRDHIAGFLPDTSFTGRTEIWEFAAEHIMKRPIFGWGFGAFWGTERTQFASSDALSWVNKASQAHNTYLDAALIMGLPGLLVTLLAFVVAPLRDLQTIAPGRRMDPATMFFLRLWLMAFAGGSFESVLFNANIAIGCMCMLAVFGLRMRAAYPIAAH